MPFVFIMVMTDRSSHLSVILNLCPTQWLLSAQPSNPHPLSLDSFLSHLLAFSNSHIVCKHENSYRVFTTVDHSLVQRISREFDILGQPDTEGATRTVRFVNER